MLGHLCTARSDFVAKSAFCCGTEGYVRASHLLCLMQVWKFYHDRRQQAQSGCRTELEVEGHEGSNCQALDNLERMVYEVAFSGDAEQLYHVLRVRCFTGHAAVQLCMHASPTVALLCLTCLE